MSKAMISSEDTSSDGDSNKLVDSDTENHPLYKSSINILKDSDDESSKQAADESSNSELHIKLLKYE